MLLTKSNAFAQIMRRSMRIKDETGKSFSLRAVFKESIRFLKEHALGAITRQEDVFPTDVFWVLTIPSIWSEPAKQFMRKAAEEVYLSRERPLFFACVTTCLCAYSMSNFYCPFLQGQLFLKKVS